jgi:hypothetical protein
MFQAVPIDFLSEEGISVWKSLELLMSREGWPSKTIPFRAQNFPNKKRV